MANVLLDPWVCSAIVFSIATTRDRVQGNQQLDGMELDVGLPPCTSAFNHGIQSMRDSIEILGKFHGMHVFACPCLHVHNHEVWPIGHA